MRLDVAAEGDERETVGTTLERIADDARGCPVVSGDLDRERIRDGTKKGDHSRETDEWLRESGGCGVVSADVSEGVVADDDAG